MSEIRVRSLAEIKAERAAKAALSNAAASNASNNLNNPANNSTSVSITNKKGGGHGGHGAKQQIKQNLKKNSVGLEGKGSQSVVNTATGATTARLGGHGKRVTVNNNNTNNLHNNNKINKKQKTIGKSGVKMSSLLAPPTSSPDPSTLSPTILSAPKPSTTLTTVQQKLQKLQQQKLQLQKNILQQQKKNIRLNNSSNNNSSAVGNNPKAGTGAGNTNGQGSSTQIEKNLREMALLKMRQKRSQNVNNQNNQVPAKITNIKGVNKINKASNPGGRVGLGVTAQTLKTVAGGTSGAGSSLTSLNKTNKTTNKNNEVLGLGLGGKKATGTAKTTLSTVTPTLKKKQVKLTLKPKPSATVNISPLSTPGAGGKTGGVKTKDPTRPTHLAVTKGGKNSNKTTLKLGGQPNNPNNPNKKLTHPGHGHAAGGSVKTMGGKNSISLKTGGGHAGQPVRPKATKAKPKPLKTLSLSNNAGQPSLVETGSGLSKTLKATTLKTTLKSAGQPVVMPSAGSDNKSALKPCMFYARGNCRKGEKCLYPHIKPSAVNVNSGTTLNDTSSQAAPGSGSLSSSAAPFIPTSSGIAQAAHSHPDVFSSVTGVTPSHSDPSLYTISGLSAVDETMQDDETNNSNNPTLSIGSISAESGKIGEGMTTLNRPNRLRRAPLSLSGSGSGQGTGEAVALTDSGSGDIFSDNEGDVVMSGGSVSDPAHGNVSNATKNLLNSLNHVSHRSPVVTGLGNKRKHDTILSSSTNKGPKQKQVKTPPTTTSSSSSLSKVTSAGVGIGGHAGGGHGAKNKVKTFSKLSVKSLSKTISTKTKQTKPHKLTGIRNNNNNNNNLEKKITFINPNEFKIIESALDIFEKDFNDNLKRASMLRRSRGSNLSSNSPAPPRLNLPPVLNLKSGGHLFNTSNASNMNNSVLSLFKATESQVNEAEVFMKKKLESLGLPWVTAPSQL